MKKTAVLTMDVEEWYDLDYFLDAECDQTISMLDGIDVFADILQSEGIRGTFFCLSEVAGHHPDKIKTLHAARHEIAVHGLNHKRPLTMSSDDFRTQLAKAKQSIEEIVQEPARGFRAPCFGVNDEHLDLVRQAGFSYDSSRMPFEEHPLYGSLSMEGYEQVAPHIYRQADFVEFELNTSPVLGRNVPVSGGAYLRVFPWFLTRQLLRRALRDSELYVLYVHPFELSQHPLPPVPEGIGRSTWARFSLGRQGMPKRIRRLIALLRSAGFDFKTFAELHTEVTEKDAT